LTSGMSCTATFVTGNTTITAFGCTAGTKTWSAANDFVATP
jgi:hypothetical protein